MVYSVIAHDGTTAAVYSTYAKALDHAERWGFRVQKTYVL